MSQWSRQVKGDQIDRCSNFVHFKVGFKRFSGHNSQTAGPIIKVNAALDSDG
jgi:hypothetical protein